MTKCERCGTPLEDMTLSEELEAAQEFRENFPTTHRDEPRPVRICDPCYKELIELYPPQEWDKWH